MIWIIDILLIAIIVVFFIYPRWTLKRNAKVVEQPEFERLMATSQLIDIREAADFRAKHILGARNLPASQMEQSLNAISKNKPVLLYENGKPTASVKVAKQLKKAGVPEVYILKAGLNSWSGKIKNG
ncbi:rhodanese-like domain-containing protein [Lactococcus garvieae]|jgi:rhodanese-related sulfurtransferase|uniref:Rhodanese-like domain protein n=1 Tax=Lactococcus garvieae DCC43 TaxID=1231377 RepID=K2NX05_9LACT|nr:rhodanese-like domain-containing protein [Lactococcus garvieae]EKF52053.1 Rhodanese-like domain protein [Lactococcus garvieae DCC43]QPS70626.1 rhodanese-like domain-containing protein [Lactococcus garvieae]